ncbi:MAG: redoxin domain-containing protein [Gemmatimonadota bacterium]
MPKNLLFLLGGLGITGAGLLAMTAASPGRISARIAGSSGGQTVARPAPAWKNQSWLNADGPVTLESLRGRVVLLNFWVYTCYNCTNTVPSLVNFDHKYREQGLTIIGIHTPEFPPYAGEHDKGNVARALKEHGIEYPNAQDNDDATWNLYRIQYWPSFVLIDKKGMIRYEGYGEFHLNDGSYQEWDRRIQGLLAE